MKRATFSNEAGVGSAAIAHSAVKTKEPITEGLVSLLEPFVDTVVICTMTALVITIAGLNTGPFDGSGLTGVTLTAASFTETAGLLQIHSCSCCYHVCFLDYDLLVLLRSESMDLPIR